MLSAMKTLQTYRGRKQAIAGCSRAIPGYVWLEDRWIQCVAGEIGGCQAEETGQEIPDRSRKGQHR